MSGLWQYRYFGVTSALAVIRPGAADECIGDLALTRTKFGDEAHLPIRLPVLFLYLLPVRSRPLCTAKSDTP